MDLVDLDGDDDLDLISASSYDNKVAWYENQGGGVFGAQRRFADEVAGASSAVAADLDGDEDLDVLTCEESANLGVIWYENPLR